MSEPLAGVAIELGRTYRIVNNHGEYLLTVAEVIDSELLGPCLRGEYRMPGGKATQHGTFCVDRITECELVPEQLVLAEEEA